MAGIDIFNNNAFEVTELTNSMDLLPYEPQLLGELKLFTQKPIRTTTAWIEKRRGKLRIIDMAARSTVGNVRSTEPREAIPVELPHMPYYQTIKADDIQNVRAFGTESELEQMEDHVNDQLEGMKADHEVTFEYHRVGALKGQILRGDGVTVWLDLFNLFGMTQEVIPFVGENADVLPMIHQIKRFIAGRLGNKRLRGIVALAGDAYFDALIMHPSIRASFDLWQDGAYRRLSHLGPAWEDAASNGLGFQNILWINYRGDVDDFTFIPTDEAYYFARGVPNLFEDIIGPPDMMPWSNTKGRRYYVSKEILPHNKGVELHTQSNVLSICKRPDTIVKSVYTAVATSSSSA